MLQPGARIILGGVLKSYQQGSRFPSSYSAKPHLVYEYQIWKDLSLTGRYQDPVFSHDDLIKLDDEVGGRCVKDVYHMEDFNVTLVPYACILYWLFM